MYLADGEHRVVGFSHGVVDEHRHQFSDFVQVSCPGFLSDKETWVQEKEKRKRNRAPNNVRDFYGDP